MSKQNTTPRFNADVKLVEEIRRHAVQINQMTEGKIAAVHNAVSSVPTTADHAQGDFIRNSAPEELGSGGSKYVVFGWQYVDTGGGVMGWIELRFLTGN